MCHSCCFQHITIFLINNKMVKGGGKGIVVLFPVKALIQIVYFKPETVLVVERGVYTNA